MQEAILFVRKRLYLQASIFLPVSGNQARTYLFLGKTFYWGTLSKGNVEDAFKRYRFRSKAVDKKFSKYDQIHRIQEKILQNCENNGISICKVSGLTALY